LIFPYQVTTAQTPVCLPAETLQAFGFPAFPVDTHIHRLMKQWKLTEGKNVVQTENDAKKLFPKETWNKLHLQIIFYGREYSPARGSQERDYITKMLFEG
jgi:endonuclease-3